MPHRLFCPAEAYPFVFNENINMVLENNTVDGSFNKVIYNRWSHMTTDQIQLYFEEV